MTERLTLWKSTLSLLSIKIPRAIKRKGTSYFTGASMNEGTPSTRKSIFAQASGSILPFSSSPRRIEESNRRESSI